MSDLPAFNEDDAPEGYRAVRAIGTSCTGCAIPRRTAECDQARCMPFQRRDDTNVVFVLASAPRFEPTPLEALLVAAEQAAAAGFKSEAANGVLVAAIAKTKEQHVR